jgi:hypothetical protein
MDLKNAKKKKTDSKISLLKRRSLCLFWKYYSNICSKKFVTDPFFGFNGAFLLQLLSPTSRKWKKHWTNVYGIDLADFSVATR